MNRPQAGVHVDVEANVRGDDAPEHVLDLRHQGVQIEHLRLEHLAPAEGQQLRDQSAGALTRLADFLQIGHETGLVRDLLLFEQELAVAQDCRQQVVEVMRNAAGQMANRLHLLCLPKLFLGQAQRLLRGAAGGDLRADLQDLPRAVRQIDRHTPGLEPALRARAQVRHRFVLVAARLSRLENGAMARDRLGHVIGGGAQGGIALANQILYGVPVQRRDRFVGEDEAARRILQRDQARVAVDHQAQHVPLDLEIPLRVAALGALAGVLQLAADRGAQPRQILLGHEVVGARLENGHRRLLVNRSREDDEGKVEPLFLQAEKRAQCAEVRQREIADHQVPDFRDERLATLRFRLHTAGVHVEAGLSEGAQNQVRVTTAVLHQQHAEGFPWGRRWFGVTHLDGVWQ